MRACVPIAGGRFAAQRYPTTECITAEPQSRVKLAVFPPATHPRRTINSRGWSSTQVACHQNHARADLSAGRHHTAGPNTLPPFFPRKAHLPRMILKWMNGSASAEPLDPPLRFAHQHPASLTPKATGQLHRGQEGTVARARLDAHHMLRRRRIHRAGGDAGVLCDERRGWNSLRAAARAAVAAQVQV